MLDTSFVVEALLESQPLHEVCSEYLVRLAEEGADLSFSELLELELCETAFQIAVKERHPRNWRRFRHDGRARRRGAALLSEVLQAWDEIVRATDATRVPIADVATEAPEFMADYGLASYDAIHAATAVVIGPRTIVTLDAGFSAVPTTDLVIFTDSARVARCRQLRGGR